MSTFNGIVREFPNIRIDFFRRHRDVKPPSACFLSHVHSDHLQGLESPILPFIYCSAATKRLLLRMEKYPHRINFAKGILEARKQTYRHLNKVLKALPLQTATTIELTPKKTIRVTLFDANHCPGAVMFLIEDDAKAILYTGDIRSEPWWVNSLVRHPATIPYTLGRKRLDCMYVDATFAAKEDVYKNFPSKAAGLAELVEKVEQYPPETVFYFRSWTLGYEDAWIALSSALKSRIHVDTYQIRLYGGLLEDYGEHISVQEAASLVGFAAGNHMQEGCLTDDPTVAVRIHSCEPGTACHADISKLPNLAWITPIISRTPDGEEVYEIGAGGGGGDLYQMPELDVADPGVIQTLQTLCADSLKDPNLTKALTAIEEISSKSGGRISLDGMDIDIDSETDVTLRDFLNLISKRLVPLRTSKDHANDTARLTTAIRFPYSRHSSCDELRELITIFKPRDICPCTVDLDTWTEDVSMESLFGDMCSEKLFIYDAENRARARERKDQVAAARKRKRLMNDDGETQRNSLAIDQISVDTFETAEDLTHLIKPSEETTRLGSRNAKDRPPDRGLETSRGLDIPASRLKAIEDAFYALNEGEQEGLLPVTPNQSMTELQEPTSQTRSAVKEADLSTCGESLKENDDTADSQMSEISLPVSAFHSQTPTKPEGASSPQSGRLKARLEAYNAAKSCLNGNDSDWNELGIRSLGNTGHTKEELEL